MKFNYSKENGNNLLKLKLVAVFSIFLLLLNTVSINLQATANVFWFNPSYSAEIFDPALIDEPLLTWVCWTWASFNISSSHKILRGSDISSSSQWDVRYWDWAKLYDNKGKTLDFRYGALGSHSSLPSLNEVQWNANAAGTVSEGLSKSIANMNTKYYTALDNDGSWPATVRAQFWLFFTPYSSDLLTFEERDKSPHIDRLTTKVYSKGTEINNIRYDYGTTRDSETAANHFLYTNTSLFSKQWLEWQWCVLNETWDYIKDIRGLAPWTYTCWINPKSTVERECTIDWIYLPLEPGATSEKKICINFWWWSRNDGSAEYESFITADRNADWKSWYNNWFKSWWNYAWFSDYVKSTMRDATTLNGFDHPDMVEKKYCSWDKSNFCNSSASARDNSVYQMSSWSQSFWDGTDLIWKNANNLKYWISTISWPDVKLFNSRATFDLTYFLRDNLSGVSKWINDRTLAQFQIAAYKWTDFNKVLAVQNLRWNQFRNSDITQFTLKVHSDRKYIEDTESSSYNGERLSATFFREWIRFYWIYANAFHPNGRVSIVNNDYNTTTENGSSIASWLWTNGSVISWIKVPISVIQRGDSSLNTITSWTEYDYAKNKVWLTGVKIWYKKKGSSKIYKTEDFSSITTIKATANSGTGSELLLKTPISNVTDILRVDVDWKTNDLGFSPSFNTSQIEFIGKSNCLIEAQATIINSDENLNCSSTVISAQIKDNNWNSYTWTLNSAKLVISNANTDSKIDEININPLGSPTQTLSYTLSNNYLKSKLPSGSYKFIYEIIDANSKTSYSDPYKANSDCWWSSDSIPEVTPDSTIKPITIMERETSDNPGWDDTIKIPPIVKDLTINNFSLIGDEYRCLANPADAIDIWWMLFYTSSYSRWISKVETYYKINNWPITLLSERQLFDGPLSVTGKDRVSLNSTYNNAYGDKTGTIVYIVKVYDKTGWLAYQGQRTSAYNYSVKNCTPDPEPDVDKQAPETPFNISPEDKTEIDPTSLSWSTTTGEFIKESSLANHIDITLVWSVYTDPDQNPNQPSTYLRTEWQMSYSKDFPNPTGNDFATFVPRAAPEDPNKLRLRIPLEGTGSLLKNNFFWRFRYVDKDNLASWWSEPTQFGWKLICFKSNKLESSSLIKQGTVVKIIEKGEEKLMPVIWIYNYLWYTIVSWRNILNALTAQDYYEMCPTAEFDSLELYKTDNVLLTQNTKLTGSTGSVDWKQVKALPIMDINTKTVNDVFVKNGESYNYPYDVYKFPLGKKQDPAKDDPNFQPRPPMCSSFLWCYSWNTGTWNTVKLTHPKQWLVTWWNNSFSELIGEKPDWWDNKKIWVDYTPYCGTAENYMWIVNQTDWLIECIDSKNNKKVTEWNNKNWESIQIPKIVIGKAVPYECSEAWKVLDWNSRTCK